MTNIFKRILENGPGGGMGRGGVEISNWPQSQKNPCLMVALPPGKFLRVRKVFARMYEIHH